MPTFRERLNDPRPILADGATGTLLHARGVPMDGVFEQLNLTRPNVIRAIHADYLAAGADAIESNTFGANRLKLADHGLDDQLLAINQAGVQLARSAITESGRTAYVIGSVGPLGVGVQPYGRLKREDAFDVFHEQISALRDADAIQFETFTDLNELLIAIEAAHAAAPDLPIIAQMTFTHDDRTISGHMPGAVARALREAGVQVVGVNCSGGPVQISRVLSAMRLAAPDARYSAMPNAGYPQTVGGRTMYPATVEYFADYALTFKAQGAVLIGGCCGTTPAHIAAMRAALDDPARPLPVINVFEPHADDDHAAPDRPTELAFKLASGAFVISVEMNPPRSHNLDKTIDSAAMLRDAGADVLNIADSPTARMRVSPWAVCNLLQNRLGMETVLHFPTRGRNLLRVQGDLLGAHALSLRNIFVCMGDPTRIGDYPDAMDNFDIAPSALIRLVKQRMNQGSDQAGNSLGQPTSFTVGCALNMGAADVDKEIDLLRKKIDAGADFALGQPVFDPLLAENFLRRYEELAGEALKLPVIMGVMPLFSARHASYIDNEIPGIDIPPAILERMANAGDQAAQEGVIIAQSLLRDLQDYVQGAYIIPAFGRYDLAAQVIDVVTALRM